MLKAHNGFWGDGGVPCDRGGDEGSEVGFFALAGVVDEQEEAEVDGQLLLQDGAVRSQPGAQQRMSADDLRYQGDDDASSGADGRRGHCGQQGPLSQLEPLPHRTH